MHITSQTVTPSTNVVKTFFFCCTLPVRVECLVANFYE
jgi:hypothetical protein